MTNRSQIVITKVKNKTVLVSMHNDKLYDVRVENEENLCRICREDCAQYSCRFCGI